MALPERTVDFTQQLLRLPLSSVYDDTGVIRLDIVTDVCTRTKLEACQAAAARADHSSVCIVAANHKQQQLLHEVLGDSQHLQVSNLDCCRMLGKSKADYQVNLCLKGQPVLGRDTFRGSAGAAAALSVVPLAKLSCSCVLRAFMTDRRNITLFPAHCRPSGDQLR
jgi:hypothetical protein